MGLNISTFRSGGGHLQVDCTNDGISSKGDLCLLNVTGPSHPSDNYAAAYLVANDALGVRNRTLKIVPAGDRDVQRYERIWYMMGGNFGFSHDSRFADACEQILGHRFHGAVPIFDRREY